MGRRKKEEISLWNMSKMIKHVQETYPYIKECVDKGTKSKDSIRKDLERIINKYVYFDDTLEAPKKDKEKEAPKKNKEKEAPKKDEEKPRRKYLLSSDVAKFLIEDIMEESYNSDRPGLRRAASERHQKRKNERYRKNVELIKKQSAREDEKLNKEIIEQLGEYHLAELDDEMNWSSSLPEGCTYDTENFGVSDGAYYYENKPNLDIIGSDYKYQIPKEPSYSNEFADKVIDRMMIRAIFDYLYEFKEEEYRRDLETRSSLIDTVEPLQVLPGFTELTKKLENPLGNYVFLKKEQKKKS